MKLKRGKTGYQYVTGLNDHAYIKALEKLGRANVRTIANETGWSIAGARSRLNNMAERGLVSKRMVSKRMVSNRLEFWIR